MAKFSIPTLISVISYNAQSPLWAPTANENDFAIIDIPKNNKDIIKLTDKPAKCSTPVATIVERFFVL